MLLSITIVLPKIYNVTHIYNNVTQNCHTFGGDSYNVPHISYSVGHIVSRIFLPFFLTVVSSFPATAAVHSAFDANTREKP